MSIFSRRRAAPEQRDALGNPSVPLYDYLLGLTDDGAGTAGVNVTPEGAMRVVAFLSCVKVLAETIASLPIGVFTRNDGALGQPILDDPRVELIADYPNPEMTAYKFWLYVVTSMAVYGNAYVWIETDGNGAVVALWPIAPSKIRKHRQGAEVRWIVDLPGGPGWLFDAEVMHFSGISLDGEHGLSNVVQARQAIGISIAAESYAGRMFESDGRPGAILSSEKPMTDEQFKSFQGRWRASHEGLRNSHRFALLPPGITYNESGFDPTNLQMVEARKFQVREMSRLLRVPPHMVNDLDGSATFASVEQLSIDFVTYSLRPWLVNIAQVVRRGLFRQPDDRKRGVFVQHDTSVLLLADSVARSKIDSVYRLAGIKTANEVRETIGLSPIKGGDVLWQPVNVQVIGADGEPALPPATAPQPAVGQDNNPANAPADAPPAE